MMEMLSYPKSKKSRPEARRMTKMRLEPLSSKAIFEEIDRTSTEVVSGLERAMVFNTKSQGSTVHNSGLEAAKKKFIVRPSYASPPREAGIPC